MSRMESQDGFAIGTVAGLTGVDVHTIRAWERRYAAIAPNRTQTGHRRYGEPQIQRLHLLRAVTDLGEPIGSVASLDDDSLRERLRRLSNAGSPGTDAPSSVGVVGRDLVQQIAAAGSPATASWDLVARVDEFDDLPRPLPAVVVVHAPRLGSSLLDRLDAARGDSPETRWVIVYEFAPRAELLALARRGIRAVKGPLRIDALQQAVADLQLLAPEVAPRAPVAWNEPGDAPPRQFDDAQLARLREMVGSVACECPSHLAALVSNLQAGGLAFHDEEPRPDLWNLGGDQEPLRAVRERNHRFVAVEDVP